MHAVDQSAFYPGCTFISTDAAGADYRILGRRAFGGLIDPGFNFGYTCAKISVILPRFFVKLGVTKNDCRMNNSTISKIGTILYALVIGFLGVNNIFKAAGIQNMVPSFIPGGVFWAYLTGFCLIAAAISFLINKQVRLAGLLLAIFLIIVVLTADLASVNKAPDEIAAIYATRNLVKDVGLAGAALIIAGKGV
jgi:uncharacterized membrane protein